MVLDAEQLSTDEDSTPAITILVLRPYRPKTLDDSHTKPIKFKKSDASKKLRAASLQSLGVSRKRAINATSRSYPIFHDLTSPELSLALRWESWGKMLCPDEALPYLMGEYLEQIPQLLGRSTAVDLCLESVIASSLALLNPTPTNYLKACELTVGAIAQLKAQPFSECGAKNFTKITLLALGLLVLGDVSSSLTYPYTYTDTGRLSSASVNRSTQGKF